MYHFLVQLVQNWGGGVSPWPCPKQFYFAEIKPDHKLTKTFYFIKIYVLAEL